MQFVIFSGSWESVISSWHLKYNFFCRKNPCFKKCFKTCYKISICRLHVRYKYYNEEKHFVEGHDKGYTCQNIIFEMHLAIDKFVVWVFWIIDNIIFISKTIILQNCQFFLQSISHTKNLKWIIWNFHIIDEFSTIIFFHES